MQHCLNVAITEWGIQLQGNPAAAITKPSDSKARDRRLSRAELDALQAALAQCRNPLFAKAVHFAIHTGMRRSEILSFRWSDLDFSKRIVHLADSKNGQPRMVPLTPAALICLPKRPENGVATDQVFPMSGNAVRLAWERLKRRAGIDDLHFHDLRHEAISRFFELGLSVPEVSLISGHKDVRMLFRYTHMKAVDVANKLKHLSNLNADDEQQP